MKTPVLIVGAGPVGLTLAIDLGRRGIDCTLIEQKPEPQFLPKMERCNARTMELFRRMGLADRIRAAGLDNDVPMDVFIITTLDKPPLLHLDYPSVNAAKAAYADVHDGSEPCEPYQLISQYTLEPFLKSVADDLPNVTVRFGTELVDFEHDAEGATATVRSLDGETSEIRADYLVGCDGGGSTVRRKLGIRLRGDANIRSLHQALFRCDELFDRIPVGDGPGKGRHYHVADDKQSFLILQDSTKHFTFHSVIENDEEMKAVFERTITVDLDYEMLFCGEWRQNLMLADRYRDGRVFLAGDAVHLVIPTGGLGMNTGVGDAVDLSWKLAATIQGWGGPGLLESYEQERYQIGDRNIGASRYASRGRQKWRRAYDPCMAEDTDAGAAARARMGALADVEQRKTNEMIGAELGYRYERSAIIWNEPGGPEHLFRDYQPSSWPGGRLPNTWLEPGTALQDRLPEGYVLLRLGGSTGDADGLATAFRKIGAPFSVMDIDASTTAREVYGFDQILVRPDLHIVWRGNDPHPSPDDLAAVATGHKSQAACG